MKKFNFIIVTAVLFAGLFAGCSKKEAGDKKMRIAVIPKGTTHVFWKAVESGAKQAGTDLNAEVIWKGPLTENDRGDQIKVVEQFILEDVDGIVIAPLDADALIRPIKSATGRGIPVAVIDSGLNPEKAKVGQEFISFIATDNRNGGKMAGKKMVELLGGEGKVVLLRYNVGSASTDKREAGFLDIMKENTGITMLVDNQYAGATVDEAIKKAEELVEQLKQADGIYCPNESVTRAMLITLKKHGLAGKVKFVGFDSSDELITGIRDGHINGLVVQDPFQMGYKGVKAIVDNAAGTAIEANIDTGAKLVTPDNIEDEDIKSLLGI